MIIKNVFGLVAIAITISGCSTNFRNNTIRNYSPPDKGIVLKIQSNQDKLRVRLPANFIATSFIGVGGLPIDHIIMDTKLNKNERFIEPILNDVKSKSVNQIMDAELRETVKKMAWLNIEKELVPTNSKRNLLPIGTHVLTLDRKYEFTPTMDSIEMTVFLSLKKVVGYGYRHNEKFARHNTIFDNRYKYISAIIDPFSKRKQRIPLENVNKVAGFKSNKRVYSPNDKKQFLLNYWLQSDSRKVKEFLSSAPVAISEMILHDLLLKKSQNDEDYFDSLVEYNQFYWLISEKQGRKILESNSWPKTGNLCSLPAGAESHRCVDNAHAWE